jgi:hypothetical protein
MGSEEQKETLPAEDPSVPAQDPVEAAQDHSQVSEAPEKSDNDGLQEEGEEEEEDTFLRDFRLYKNQLSEPLDLNEKCEIVEKIRRKLSIGELGK